MGFLGDHVAPSLYHSLTVCLRTRQRASGSLSQFMMYPSPESASAPLSPSLDSPLFARQRTMSVCGGAYCPAPPSAALLLRALSRPRRPQLPRPASSTLHSSVLASSHTEATTAQTETAAIPPFPSKFTRGDTLNNNYIINRYNILVTSTRQFMSLFKKLMICQRAS